jgi:hypothetical protein
MARLKCKTCGALAHEVLGGVPYCATCATNSKRIAKKKTAKKEPQNLSVDVIECGCAKNIPPYSATPINTANKAKEHTEKKSWWKKLFSK